MPATKFYHHEYRAVISLSLIFAFRLLGLFMILPVFSLAAVELPGATPSLIGLALGIYGLTQALFQIPLGVWSDRIGRKPVIIAGLLVFVLGSVIAALASSIDGIILGRALQGAGAIGSTLIAAVADLTKVENRTKAMSLVGMSIGLSFALSLMLGPLIHTYSGLSGIFGVTALLGMLGIIFIIYLVPKIPRLIFHHDTEAIPALLFNLIKSRKLLPLNLGVFILHAILTATFIVIPLLLVPPVLNLAKDWQWLFYLPILLFSFILMAPLIIVGEKKRQLKMVLLISISMLAIIEFYFALYFEHLNFWSAGILLTLFFAAFTALESSLPSIVSKIAAINQKGTAISIYSTFQFFGIFVGGSAGGIIFKAFGIHGIFIFCAVLALLWLLFALLMAEPPYLVTRIFQLSALSSDELLKLKTLLAHQKNIYEYFIEEKENRLYLKIDNKKLADKELNTILRAFLI